MNFNIQKSVSANCGSQAVEAQAMVGRRRHWVRHWQSVVRCIPICSVGFSVIFLPTPKTEAQTLPGAGIILQQDRPPKPLVPSSTDTDMSFKLEGGAEMPDSPPFLVKSIEVTGNTLYDSQTLHALVAEAEGKVLTLPQLAKLAMRITDYYRHQGYLLSHAVIPAQIIEGGVVHVKVVEARYGKIKLDNRSKVHDSLLEDTLSPLESDEVVTESQLNHALLLASDVPGVAVSATLSPGELDGTSDLNVQANATSEFTGNAALDNDGNRYTGRTRVGATANLIGPLHHGDVLSIAALTSGKDMNYANLSYDTLLNGMGISIGASISGLHYTLGDTLAALGAHGLALEKTTWLKVPFARSQNFNLYGQIEYDHKQLNDEIDTTSLHTDRHLNTWGVVLTGDMRDSIFSGGTNTWSINWREGRVAFDDSAAKAADFATAKTQGRFAKWNWNLARQQTLGPNDALFLSFGGQSTNSNLDASEKMLVGGPYSVRAYDIGAISADTGSFESIEYRHIFDTNEIGYWTAIFFVDHEHVTINKKPWAGGINSDNLTGTGVGINWVGIDHWMAKAFIATPVGAVPQSVGAGSSTWVWIDVSKGF